MKIRNGRHLECSIFRKSSTVEKVKGHTTRGDQANSVREQSLGE